MTIKPLVATLLTGAATFFSIFSHLGFASDKPTELIIGAYDHFPFHYQKEDKVTGTAIKTLNCVMESIGQKYLIEMYPQLRGEQLFKQNKLDALLSFPENYKQRFHSLVSDPIAYERWNMYFNPKKKNVRDYIPLKTDQLSIGSIRGGAVEDWLKTKNIQSTFRAINVDQLTKMLYGNRIDAFIADEKSMNLASLNITAENDSTFDKILITFSPLSIHFSPEADGIDQAFIEAFNQAIPQCQSTTIELSHRESQTLWNTTRYFFENYFGMSEIRDSLILSNLEFSSQPSDKHIQELDKQWRDPNHNGHEELLSKVLNSEGSELLRKIQSSSQGLILEIIVINKYGVNVLASHKTTDYYQGDEDKFIQAIQTTTQTPHISPIRFDASAREFGTQISIPIESGSKNIGVVTFTIDLGKVFTLPPIKEAK
jgi:ABC-type amino acid transport substrate-binding protein